MYIAIILGLLVLGYCAGCWHMVALAIGQGKKDSTEAVMHYREAPAISGIERHWNETETA